jgi:hypothetical protein
MEGISSGRHEKEKMSDQLVSGHISTRYIPNSSPEEKVCDGVKLTELACGLGAARGSADACNIH